MIGISPTEILFVAVVLLIAVGPKGFPAVIRAMGKGLREVRKATHELKQSIGFDELMRDDSLRDSLDLRKPLKPPARTEPAKRDPESPTGSSSPEPAQRADASPQREGGPSRAPAVVSSKPPPPPSSALSSVRRHQSLPPDPPKPAARAPQSSPPAQPSPPAQSSPPAQPPLPHSKDPEE